MQAKAEFVSTQALLIYLYYEDDIAVKIIEMFLEFNSLSFSEP